ncbi:DDE Tnp4 domain-containing protein [Aphis craccivora]|uniref:DDE Tnp4 domain-containing protein n=1 Tax=Aphis craccivora TaxID=307492 RepID=A0A6G0ZJ37_APHCR|nr:DDE Tnp4 domain-containing protein [Aphis craccivora]
MDGKHVVIQAPINTGSCQGRISDAGVFQNCQLNKRLKSNSLDLPLLAPLPGRRKKVPYFCIGDGAIPLTENIMKPFPGLHSKGTPQRIYNYRLSRARRVVENVFAHLHNFLRRNNNSAAIYTLNGIFDSEVKGNFIEGTRRNTNNEEISSLRPIRRVARKSALNSMEIREEEYA